VPEPPSITSAVLCPRCGAGFDCGRDSARCWCAGVTLEDSVRADFARFYEGCLCPDCLRAVEDAREPRPDVWRFLMRNLKRKRG
jgi:hypothetical protein